MRVVLRNLAVDMIMFSCQFYPTHVLALVLLGCFASVATVLITLVLVAMAAWLHMTATAAATATTEPDIRFAKGAKKRPHVDEDEDEK